MYQLGDIFIGHYDIIQEFGVRPDIYSARYHIRGHNGVDWACPPLTPILAGAAGIVVEIGFDEGAFGRYVTIQHVGFLTKYGHLNDTTVQKGDVAVCGALIGHSNRTGLSDTPHLHFGIAPCDASGVKTERENGFNGWIDPLGERIKWNILNLVEPAIAQVETNPKILVSAQIDSERAAQANSFAVVFKFAENNGLHVYLANEGAKIQITDSNAGERVNAWIADMLLKLHDNKTHGRYVEDDEEGDHDPLIDLFTDKSIPWYKKIWPKPLRDFIFV